MAFHVSHVAVVAISVFGNELAEDTEKHTLHYSDCPNIVRRVLLDQVAKRVELQPQPTCSIISVFSVNSFKSSADSFTGMIMARGTW